MPRSAARAYKGIPPIALAICKRVRALPIEPNDPKAA